MQGKKKKYCSWKRDFNFKWTLFHISQKYFYRHALPRFWTLDFFNTIKWHLERNMIFYRKNTYLFSFLCFNIFSKETRKIKAHSISILISNIFLTSCIFFWRNILQEEDKLLFHWTCVALTYWMQLYKCFNDESLTRLREYNGKLQSLAWLIENQEWHP